MRKLLIAVVLVAVCGAAATTAPAARKTRTVKVGDNWFVRDGKPTRIAVKKGTRVRWRWVGSAPHNVTVVKGPRKFRSKTMTRGTFTRKLRKRGVYKLVCTIHGGDQRMTIRVRR